MPESRCSFPPEPPLNIEVVGFHSLSAGIGVSARLCAKRLAAAGFKVNCRDISSAFLKKPEIAWSWDNSFPDELVNCRIFHLNPPMLPWVILSMGLKNFRSTYNIAYWAWEADLLPPEWQLAMRYINAIFVPSRFNKSVFRKYTDKPVFLVPHPVTVDAVEDNVRASLGIAPDDFLATYVFSFGSVFERKNPLAVIDAFNQAFAGTDNACLVLKSSHGGKEARDLARLQAAIEDFPNIRLIDEVWPTPRVMGLIAGSNVFISLHRSEGFGLPVAEAISLEVPVVTTNWSGNVDFCDPDNTHLVSASLTEIDQSSLEFRSLEGARWADADTAEAAGFLRAIFDDPVRAKERAKNAKIYMDRYLAEHTYPKAIEDLQSAIAGSGPLRN